jgi:hypothetical protein
VRKDIEYTFVRSNVRLRDDAKGPFFNWGAIIKMIQNE